MSQHLNDRQRAAQTCPDCHELAHTNTCRRLAMGTEANRVDLQCGPPWTDWPDWVKPVNPLAKP